MFSKEIKPFCRSNVDCQGQQCYACFAGAAASNSLLAFLTPGEQCLSTHAQMT